MKWFRFIVSHSLFIAACAAAQCFQTAILLKADLSYWFYLFVFFSTICSYNFYWLLSSYSFSRGDFMKHLRRYYTNGLVLFFAAAGLLFSLQHLQGLLPVITVSAALTLIYAVPLLPFKSLQFARRAGLLKTALLAFTWAFTVVYIPYSHIHAADTKALLLLFLIRFLFMLMLCIIFDARDTHIDKIRGLESLTTMFRPFTVRLIMVVLFAAYITTGIIYRLHYNETGQIAALLLTGLAVAVTYFLSLKKQGYFFYYFWVDGLMLFSAAITFMVSIS
ncbi:MAG: hypothetical protein U0V75_12090 [Ferruginibacter sp.]